MTLPLSRERSLNALYFRSADRLRAAGELVVRLHDTELRIVDGVLADRAEGRRAVAGEAS